jgi:hypothetical protein
LHDTFWKRNPGVKWDLSVYAFSVGVCIKKCNRVI